MPWPLLRDNDADALSQLVDAPLVVTKISHSSGGFWQMIPAPQRFRHSACDRCNNQRDCFLHLHGNSAWHFGVVYAQYPNLYSHPAAPGVLMATGTARAVRFNIGCWLEFCALTICVSTICVGTHVITWSNHINRSWITLPA